MTASTQTYEDRDLAKEWARLKEDGVRIRAAAEQLGCSEAELLEVTPGYTVTPLNTEFAEMFHYFPQLGEVMASTRNEWAVIEKHGTYDNVDVGEKMGIVLDKEIDLRLFMWNYARAYAVVNPDHVRGPLRSIQFFDKAGGSLHKVYLKGDDAQEKHAAFIDRFGAPEAEPFVPEQFEPSEEPELPAEAELDKFRDEWRALEDTHDFFGLLRSYGLTRRQAMQNGPEELVSEVPTDVLPTMLETARDREVPIMCFVGSRGCIEIHTGPIQRVVERGGWLNVLDRRFNLHLNQEGVATTWLVKKPTVDGIVTSIECLAENGDVIAQFFGERKPGIPELESWRELIADIT
jgi:putative hemin transport protein